jgi:hypothetical protein
MYLGATDPAVKRRQAIEKRIVEAVVDEALKQGYELSVDDGEETHPATTERAKVIDAIMETDEDYLTLLKNGVEIGWVRFVYGNEGWTVISDYSDNDVTRSVIASAEKIAESYE